MSTLERLAWSRTFGIDVLPEPRTDQADHFHGVWWFTNWAGLAVAVLVWGLVAWCVLRYRRRPSRSDLPDQRGDRVRLEVAYTLASLALVIAAFTVSVVAQEQAEADSTEPDLVIDVVGFNWQWQFRYPDGQMVTGTEDAPPVLVLPADRNVRLRLRSPDVIHSFWVPGFLTKRDLIPGIDNELDIRIKEPGTWDGTCAEFCGLDHHRMRFRVQALAPDAFDDWLADAA